MIRDFIPGAEPLFLEGSEIGCLLLHGGGGGTTWDLKEFAKILHSRTGMTVWLPALSGYGTKSEDLEAVTFENLCQDAHDGLDHLLTTCKKVFVVGHSAGGLLTLVLASERKEISGIVTWAAPLAVKERKLSLLPTLSKIPLLKRAIPERYPAPVPQWLKDQGWIGYESLPISVGFIMLEGIERMKKALVNVRCPALVIQGAMDSMVSENSPKRIYEELGSERKEILIIDGADHPMMNEEKYKHVLFDRSLEFLQSIT